MNGVFRPSGPGGEVMVAIAALTTLGSPRLAGENAEHIRMLAGVDGEVPPIIVHRETMRVIDGVHRLRAAQQRGETEIRATFFEGPEHDAFVLAVEANTKHGLPLSPTDRVAAAARILVSHPHWSDRTIAARAGIATRTVAGLRARSTDNVLQLNSRVGRDGRVRPLDSSEGRRRAGQLLQSDPTASLREIAKTAGISPATVRDVRRRLGRGDEPVLSKRSRDRDHRAPGHAGNEIPRTDHAMVMRSLQLDPSLRFTESGRALIRLLNAHLIEQEAQRRLIDSVPAHCLEKVALAARDCAAMWQDFAAQLSRRQDSTA